MRSAVGAAVLAGLWSTSVVYAASPDAQTHIRRTASGHLLVRATVEGTEGWFVLDTAASSSVLTPAFAADVLADRTIWREVPVAGVGGTVDAPVYRPIEVVVQDGSGSYPRTLDYAVVLEIPDLTDGVGEEVCGILGLDLLKLGPVHIDSDAPSIRWQVETPPARSAQKLDKLRGGLLVGLLAVRPESNLDGPVRTVRGVLDLGSPVTLVNQHAVQSLALSPVAPLDAASFSGADGQSVDALEVRDLRCELVGSAREVLPCTLSVADAPVFESLAMDEEPAAVLGTDVIVRPFVLDARRARLWWR